MVPKALDGYRWLRRADLPVDLSVSCCYYYVLLLLFFGTLLLHYPRERLPPDDPSALPAWLRATFSTFDQF